MPATMPVAGEAQYDVKEVYVGLLEGDAKPRLLGLYMRLGFTPERISDDSLQHLGGATH